MKRIADWVWERMLPQRSVIDGHVVVNDSRLPLRIRKKIFRGRYERAERQAVAACVGAEDRVLEIGTALGIVGLLCAKKCNGKTLHYEPNPATQDIIRENFSLNSMQCNLRQRAITAEGGEVTFHQADNIWSSSLLPRNLERQITVPSDAIDKVIAEFAPTVIVMDVEGSELPLVEKSAFVGVRAIIFESHPQLIGKDGERRTREKLERLGFRLMAYGGKRRANCLTYVRQQADNPVP